MRFYTEIFAYTGRYLVVSVKTSRFAICFSSLCTKHLMKVSYAIEHFERIISKFNISEAKQQTLGKKCRMKPSDFTHTATIFMHEHVCIFQFNVYI